MTKKMNNVPEKLVNNLILEEKDLLSEYNIMGIIGKGTFSIVKLGENKITKEKVAIKIMQKRRIKSKEEYIRIYREIEMLKSLNHPNVIKIHKILEDSKTFYIIMEYCQNGELFNRIVQRQHLNENEAAFFYYQLINGLEYIHQNNIVHRDLKPENLLLSKDDELKIIDFGLSNYSQLNMLLGTPCGSPCYASPEMVSGQKYDGYMIDIWSTGIILYAMTCGYLPFEDNDNEVLFLKILKCNINYPKYVGELSLDLMKKIIVTEPSKRITLEKIKEHPFYLKGKTLFNHKFNRNENINNNNDNNSLYIKNKIMKIKEKIDYKIRNEKMNYISENNLIYLEQNNNNKKILSDNIICDNLNNSKNGNNFIKQNKLDNKIKKEDNNNIKNIKNNIQNYGNKKIEIKKSINKEKENLLNIEINDNINNNCSNNKHIKMESISSILDSDEIPMDTVPKDYNNNNQNMNPYLTDKKDNKIKEKEKRKENCSSKNSTTETLSYQKIENNIWKPRKTEIRGKSERITVNLVEDLNDKDRMTKNNKKDPQNNLKNSFNIIIKKNENDKNNNENNKAEEKINFQVRPLFINEIDNNYDSNKLNGNFNKTKYSFISNHIPKMLENKLCFDEKDKILINNIKVNNISNSAPKNNEKNKSCSSNKYPHNNYSKKKHKSIKTEEKTNSQKNKNPNINNLENNKIENNVNLKIINKIKNSNNNLVKNTQKKYKSGKNNLVVEIYNFFNDSQIKSKTNNGPKNNILKNNNIMSHNSKNNTNINDNKNKQNLLSEKDNKNERKESKHNVKKESYDLRKHNNYLNSFNSSKSNNIISNNQNLVNSSKKFENNNKIIYTTTNNKSKNKLENTPFEGLKTENYFETITLNSNYSINSKKPKIFIYGDKNNNNKYENLKTYNNKGNKLKNVFGDKKIKKMIYKKETTTEKKNNKINQKNRYPKINSEKFDIGKKNKSITIPTDLSNISINANNNNGNKKNINMLKKKINSEYLLKSTDMLNGLKDKDKNKENNNYIGNNKSTNIINNYINNINNFNINYLSKNDKLYVDKDDFLFKHINNIIKPNKNSNIDCWSYNNKRIGNYNYDNSLNNQYILSDSGNNKKNITERNLKVNTRSIYFSNEIPVLSYNNIDNKIKLDKTKKNELLYSNNYNANDYNQLAPIITNPNAIEYETLENRQSLSTSPITTNKNYSNIRKYEKFVKQYSRKKVC